jgi:hypothetical protein
MSYTAYYIPALRNAVDGWEQVEPLMRSTSGDFATASVSALAPSVQSAATTFLSAWKGFADESAAIVGGFAEQLTAFTNDMVGVEDGVKTNFDSLDARLGPSS